MRGAWIAIILLAATVPTTARAAEEPLLTDPQGDAEWVPTVVGQPLPGAPAGSSPLVEGNDLLALRAAESEDALAITVHVVSMQGEPQGTATLTQLAFRDREYQLAMGYFTGTLSTSKGASYAYLQVREGDAWSYVARLDAPLVDRDAGTITASVQKVLLMDGQRRIPARGDAVEVVRVLADANYVGLGVASARVRDEMAGGATLTMGLGDFVSGDLAMTAPDRVRVSNGGATTFVFQVELRNAGDAAHEMRLGIEDLPDGWQARVQQTVTIAAGAEKSVSVLVSVPFAHEHGGYSSLNLTALSARDAATQGRMRLGVLHTPIPQPAGHHSDLFLHAQNNYGGPLGPPFEATMPSAWGWMNTDAEHATDHAFVTPAGTSNGGPVWWIPLNPRLLMGLDFDLDGTGTLQGAIAGGAGEVELIAELYYWRDTSGGGESILVAEGTPTAVTLDRQGEAAFTLALTPTEESDYIPYAPDTYLALMLAAPGLMPETLTGNPARPRLMTEPFKLSLPLNEYHDRLSGASEVSSGLELVAKGAVEKTGRGGSTQTYAFDLSGTPGATVVVDLAGNDAHVGRAVPAGTLILGETATEILVGVELPADANPGQEFEVLLFVHARDDPTQVAIARTSTRVAAQGEDAAADETATLLEAEARTSATPGPGALALLAALLLAISWRRR